jgi:ribosomal protein S18 acetylase RimI-like enzyme
MSIGLSADGLRSDRSNEYSISKQANINLAHDWSNVMIEIKKLSDLDEKQVNQSVEVFVEGFYFTLKSLSKDKEKLHKLFKNSFDYNMTYACLQDGEAVGFVGLANDQKRPTKLDKEIFIEIMGGFAKKLSYKAASAGFERPKAIGPQDIYIDYIATSPEHRSKGIGTQLIEFVRDTLDSKHIELETYAKNTRAIALYERLGFKVTRVKKSFIMRLKGFGNMVYMRLDTE